MKFVMFDIFDAKTFKICTYGMMFRSYMNVLNQLLGSAVYRNKDFLILWHTVSGCYEGALIG
jgi:hypothetical protein